MEQTQKETVVETKVTQEMMDQINNAVLEERAKLNERQRMGIVYTPDGEKVQWNDGTIEEPEEKPFALPLLGWKDKHHRAMLILAECVRQINKLGRKVPLTRPEAEKFGLEKQTLKELERYGLIRNVTTPMISKTGKRMAPQSLVFCTPQGNAYLRDCRSVSEEPDEAPATPAEPELGPEDPKA